MAGGEGGNLRDLSRNALARDKTRYHDAAVAPTNREIVEQALALIEVNEQRLALHAVRAPRREDPRHAPGRRPSRGFGSKLAASVAVCTWPNHLDPRTTVD